MILDIFKEYDKQLHMKYGAIISLITTALFWTTTPYAPLIGIFMSLLAGITKEAFDKYIKMTRWDNRDILATVIGGCIAIPLLFISLS